MDITWQQQKPVSTHTHKYKIKTWQKITFNVNAFQCKCFIVYSNIQFLFVFNGLLWYFK